MFLHDLYEICECYETKLCKVLIRGGGGCIVLSETEKMISLVDQHLVQLLAECVLGVSVLVFLLSLKFSAWYGRFYTSQSRDRLSVSSKLGWFVQECPAFFVPVLIFVSARFAGHSLSLPNQILLCLFLCHYFQR